MTHEEAERILAGMGFAVAVNQYGRWVAVKGARRVFGADAIEILTTVKADYRPGRERA